MTTNRFWEIDFLRGAAVCTMVVSNLITDLYFFKVVPGAYPDSWRAFAIVTASIFISLVGVSLSISYARTKDALSEKQAFLKFAKRGAGIFLLGMLATLATWLFVKEGFVVFGVLHLIGLSVILAFPFLKLGKPNLILGCAAIALGIFLQNIQLDSNWLVWLGLAPAGFRSVDFFPLLPWFGLVLIGIFSGQILYPAGKRSFKVKERASSIFSSQICFLGRHSLAVYVAHQPIIVALLWLFGLINL